MALAILIHAFRSTAHARPLRRVACALTALSCLMWAGPGGVRAAPIPTDSLHLTVHQVGNAFSITAVGVNELSHALLLVYVHFASQSGEVPKCASDPHVEAWVVTKESRASMHAANLVYQGLKSGRYAIHATWGPGASPGSYWVCGYLVDSSAQPANVLARNSAHFTVGTQAPPSPAPHIEILSFYTISFRDYYRYWVSPNPPSDFNSVPVSRFPRGTTGVGLEISFLHATSQTNNVRYVFHNESTGATFRSGADFIPKGATFDSRAPGNIGRCFNWGGAECYTFKGNTGIRVRPVGAYPAGTYRVDMLIAGRSVASTSFTVAR